jgi:hypothetical protein
MQAILVASWAENAIAVGLPRGVEGYRRGDAV